MKNVKSDAICIDDKFRKLRELIFAEKDLSYATNQNVLLSCDRDGCSRINNCTCDCNDGC